MRGRARSTNRPSEPTSLASTEPFVRTTTATLLCDGSARAPNDRSRWAGRLSGMGGTARHRVRPRPRSRRFASLLGPGGGRAVGSGAGLHDRPPGVRGVPARRPPRRSDGSAPDRVGIHRIAGRRTGRARGELDGRSPVDPPGRGRALIRERAGADEQRLPLEVREEPPSADHGFVRDLRDSRRRGTVRVLAPSSDGARADGGVEPPTPRRRSLVDPGGRRAAPGRARS